MRNSTKKFTSAVLSFEIVAIAAGATFAQSSSSDDWTGVYVGGHAGITVGRTGVNTSTIFDNNGYFVSSSVPAVNAAGARTIESNGFNGGGQGGYNKQFGRFVIGWTTDICVLFTAHDAYMRKFKVRVPSDCTNAIRPTHHSQALTFLRRVAEADVSPYR